MDGHSGPGHESCCPYFEVCNYLDDYEDIYEIYSFGPGEDDWYLEFDGMLDWGDCYWSDALWPGTWYLSAYDEDDFYYCATLELSAGNYGYWNVDYSFYCE